MNFRSYKSNKRSINEAVSKDEVLNAIHNNRYVRIKYDDERLGTGVGDPKGTRVIMPMAYGSTKAGNPVVRAYQTNGNSRRGAPKWKYFRLDRITSWKPLNKTFEAPPDDLYNYTGDRSMGVFVDNSKFNFNTKGDIDVKREKNAVNAPKISTTNVQGPIGAAQQWKKNVFTSQPNSKKYAEYAKNIEQSGKKDDDYWKMYNLADAERDLTKQGPIKSYDDDEYDIDDIDIDNNSFKKNS